ncbi:MAG: iron-containing alcohol dehydrogenase [Eubacteriales bacterium]|nr:iron-containing alcohol dehydrogenase [Christensenellaceae bacterium]MEA5064771.1 iron-containing alcohol dehydrogenase [Eubacteriales bacterium]
MLNFEWHIPTRFVFGRDAELKAGETIRRLGGTKVLLHFGGGSAVKSGLIDRVEKSVLDAGLHCVKLGGVQPNPRDEKIYEGIELARAQGVDFVLAVGGGSTIDSAKAIADGVCYDGDFWDFFSGKALPQKALPVGVVLTLAAAGSESSNSAVITQAATKTKRGLNHELHRPQFALMNPELTMTLPAYQTACGIVDMMAHILERYFTDVEDVDVTDRIAEGLLMTIIRAGRAAIKDPMDYDARAQLMWSGTLAHNNTCGVGRQGDWASHQIEHELSALYDVAHGAGLAVVLPAWMRFVYKHNPMRFAQLATRVWGCQMDFEYPERAALLGIEQFEAFIREIGMPLTLRELGARSEDIPFMAGNTKKNNADKTGFFMPLSTEQIEEVLRLADRP